MKKNKVFILIFALILTFGLACGSSQAKSSVKVEPHKYVPIAPSGETPEAQQDPAGLQIDKNSVQPVTEGEREDRAFNMCEDPLHKAAPTCDLISWNEKGAGYWTSKTSATVKDVKLSTIARTKHLKKNDLKAYIIKKAKAKFRNTETNALLKNIHVVSVTGMDIVEHLSIPAGSMTVTIALGLSPEKKGKAEAYIQTRVRLVYETEKKKSSTNKSTNSSSGSSSYSSRSSSFSSNSSSFRSGLNSGSNSYSALAKKRAAQKKAREKAEKERQKRLTANISPKERENDTDVAVAADSPVPVKEGPSTEGILLLIAAAALAVVYGWLIRSDLRVMRWYKQKKAMRR